MKYGFFIMGILIVLGAMSCLKAEPKKMIYKSGDKIKNYKLVKDDGAEIRTDDYLGKWIVIYFYPKDDTPGCTKEAQTFTTMIDDFKAAGAVVFGVNTDTPESHRDFKEKYGLKVTLLTDSSREIMEDFGVKIIGGFCARDSVLINKNGQFVSEFRGVSPSSHPREILTYIIGHSK